MLLCITNKSIKLKSFVYIQFNNQTVLFSISHLFTLSSIWPTDRTLSDVTIPNQSGPGSDSNEGVLHIPQSSSITGASPSDCLMSYPWHLLVMGSYLSIEISQCILQSQPTGLILEPVIFFLCANSLNFWIVLIYERTIFVSILCVRVCVYVCV